MVGVGFCSNITIYRDRVVLLQRLNILSLDLGLSLSTPLGQGSQQCNNLFLLSFWTKKLFDKWQQLFAFLQESLNEAESQISRLEVTRKSLGGDQNRLQAALNEKDSEIKVIQRQSSYGTVTVWSNSSMFDELDREVRDSNLGREMSFSYQKQNSFLNDPAGWIICTRIKIGETT